ncbi:hypothetical protein G3567_05130 [Psychroflexus sp. YR1-1]|uniref:Membrane or secreted protein n=1 Tax=Psychroflexus aurantiacus TaxID=2709310 RepID=A0A6B3R7N6_9FLAO|nr:hypothetical protein [Psychroflexus aurantiacus]NEV93534.1 hypothetical protein [Psychroflexus aurantiacus]
MKNLCFTIILLCFVSFLSAQSLEGSWQLTHLNGDEVADREVIKIIVDGYFALGSKRMEDDSFLGAAGGAYKVIEDRLIEKRDFDTYDESKINEERHYDLTWVGEDKIQISDHAHTKIWERRSSATDELSGNWLITGRERNGEMKTMTPGDRRTLKILHGERFQWVAFNSASKTFMASGGGSYTAQDGVYTEHLTFFSKDRDRVGANLDFNFEVIDGKWHHQGESSKGESIYELWSPYAEAYPTDFIRQN